MARVAFVADVHIGNHRRMGGPVTATINRRCRLVIETLHRAIEAAYQAGARTFVVAGDLFDVSKPEPQVITAVQNVFRMYGPEGPHDADPMVFYVLVGNHEQTSTAPGDHALGPLKPFATIVEQPGIFAHGGAQLWLVPFVPGDASEWLPKALFDLEAKLSPKSKKSPRVLVLHMGISDDETAPWLRDAHDAIKIGALDNLCDEHEIDAVFAGNWHDRRRWFEGYAGEVFQLGALAPTGFDNLGLDGYGTVGIFDSETGAVDFSEVAGPRFVKVRTADELAELTKKANELGHKLFAVWETASEEAQASIHYSAELTDKQELQGVEVQIETAEMQARSRSAAQAASSSDTLDAALASFVDAMPLAEGVERVDVLNLSKRYLTEKRT